MIGDGSGHCAGGCRTRSSKKWWQAISLPPLSWGRQKRWWI